jgi:hypothetical protein
MLVPFVIWIALCVLCTRSEPDIRKSLYLDRFVVRNHSGSSPSYVISSVQATPDSGISSSAFENVVRRGIPSVFVGVASEELNLRGLSCADYSGRWPNASMRAEYTGREESEAFLKLGDGAWVNETRPPVGMNSPNVDCDDQQARESRPEVAPFVWHVKDRVTRSIKEEIARLYKGLPFLSKGSFMDEQTRDSMEFWFQQVGAGTFAHNDGYCHSVFSVQLRGKKKWRLMLAPEVTKLSRDVFDEFDSGIYNSVHKWAPDFEVVLNEGDGILFPPGYMHETRTVDGPSEEDRCATSVTFNIPLPLPSRFIREFMARFSVSREIHQCMRRWESFVTAQVGSIEWGKPVPDNAQPKEIAVDIFTRIDSNADKEISLVEITKYLTESEESLKFRDQRSVHFADMAFVFSPRRTPSNEMQTEALHARAQDTLDMWDVNEDGIATFEEVKDVVEFFQYYRWRQEVVDSAVTLQTTAGETFNLPIGSDPFTKRLELVEKILEKIRPEPPVLDRSKYPHINRRDEL